jgi:transposase-like protein
MSERKHHSAEQKIIILRELLENNVPISQLAEKYNIHPNDIYNWKKKLFESAVNIFNSKQPKQTTSAEEKKIAKLEEKLKDREEAITYLVTENIELKKNINGED